MALRRRKFETGGKKLRSNSMAPKRPFSPFSVSNENQTGFMGGKSLWGSPWSQSRSNLPIDLNVNANANIWG